MKIAKVFVAIGSAILLTAMACNSKKGATATSGDAVAESESAVEESSVGVSLDGDAPIIMRKGLNGLDQKPVVGVPPMHLPKALLYKTSGNFNDRVPVQLSTDGKQLVSFPAPTDIPASPEPLVLADGWLLSPVGVTASSVFTRWTYAEYRAMKQTPSPDEIMQAIIPGAKVTMTMQAPMTQSEAMADTTAVNEYIMANQIILAPRQLNP